MNFKNITFLFFFIICLFLVSCNENKNFKEDYLVGTWTSNFNTKNFTGIDTLTFNHKNILINHKQILYRDSDSGFNVSLLLNTSITGNWYIKSDSIIIKYDYSSLKIAFDDSKFHITPIDSNANERILLSLKEEMRDKLYEHLKQSIADNYNQIPASGICIGRVTKVTQREIVVFNGVDYEVLKKITCKVSNLVN